MPRSGGTYSLPAGNPVVTGTTIATTWANPTLSDIGNELTNSIARDGTSAPTANIPMGGFKLTGLGAPSNSGDSLAWGQTATLTTLTANSLNVTDSTPPANGIYLPGANTLGFAVNTAAAGSLTSAVLTMPTLAVTGATVPANGIYLPSANSLGFASNTLARGSVNSTGNWSLSAPTAGVALTLAGFTGSQALSAANSDNSLQTIARYTNSSSGNSAQARMDLTTGLANTQFGMALLNNSGSPVAGLFCGTAVIEYFYDAPLHLFRSQNSATTFATINSTGLTINGTLTTNTAPFGSFNGGHVFALADAPFGYGVVIHSGTTSHNFTIPLNASVAFPTGTTIFLGVQGASGAAFALVRTGGVVLRFNGTDADRTVGSGGGILIKVGTDEWIILSTGGVV